MNEYEATVWANALQKRGSISVVTPYQFGDGPKHYAVGVCPAPCKPQEYSATMRWLYSTVQCLEALSKLTAQKGGKD